MKYLINVLHKPSLKTFFKAFGAVCAFIGICGAIFFVGRLLSKDYPAISQHILLDDAWQITINDTSYHDISLNNFRFDSVNKGDTVTMERKLPEQLNLAEGVLCLHIYQSAVTMYIDNEIIYEYGHDRMAQHKTVGSGPLYIDFPKDYQGKMLKIELDVFENKAFSKFDPVRIYEWRNIYKVLITENRIPLFLGCFLVIFGTVTCCTSVYALLFSRKLLRIFCVSLFSICMGLWTLCYYNVIAIFPIPLYSICLLEFLSLYLAPIPLMFYMGEDVNTLGSRKMKILYLILLTIQITTTVCLLTLHAVNIVHFAATLRFMQSLIICNLIFFIIIEILNLRSSRLFIHKLFLVGMLILSGCIGYDLISYYTSRFQGKSGPSLRGVSSIGMVTFLCILFVSFYISLTQKLMEETERNSLIKSAYTDELTQIHNRRYCMEYMNRIDISEDTNYTVFCFDLNNLKLVNDTYGHAKGDILLKCAAEVIAKTFDSCGIVARMGGDEFIAISKTADASEITALMKNFLENIQQKNQEMPDLNMSIACGYASCSTKEDKIEKIYQIADNRMYENKKQMKLYNESAFKS